MSLTTGLLETTLMKLSKKHFQPMKVKSQQKKHKGNVYKIQFAFNLNNFL